MSNRNNYKQPEPHCSCCGPVAVSEYTRHHIVPRGHPVYAAYVARRKQGPETMPLCKECHNLLHKTFGEGHKFRGPMTYLSVTAWLKTAKAKQYA
jgi:5-methylcytosine-specific restriction endonuclease McrA